MPAHDIASARAAWLATLDAEHLRALLDGAAYRAPALSDWLDLQRASNLSDPSELLAIVNRALAANRHFYDYRQANEYADDCFDTVELLERRALDASPGLLPVIERAITLSTRAILKSDDSSGAQGALIHALLQAHATATRTSAPPLTQTEQTRLVTWIIKYRYGGTQDFFDPDIVAYAPGLSSKSIEKYRSAITNIDLGQYGSYPLTRLAVLDGNRDAIIATNGGEPQNAFVAARIVSDLEEAGLHDDAIDYAKRGITLDARGWDQKLVTFVVDDAFARGDTQLAVTLRREWFARFPGAASFETLRETAERAGVWMSERDAAESQLAQRASPAFVTYLLAEGRNDQAWQFANETIGLTGDATLWLKLCERRAQTHPVDTLPIYRTIVTDTLTITDKRAYQSAAKVLKTMRTVATGVGPDSLVAFEAFLAETVDRNRRRPTCIETFARAGLIPRR